MESWIELEIRYCNGEDFEGEENEEEERYNECYDELEKLGLGFDIDLEEILDNGVVFKVSMQNYVDKPLTEEELIDLMPNNMEIEDINLDNGMINAYITVYQE